ncbi:unknown protein [Desulfotalea psychrophila LSv54]|uniref:Uncharacterized protein n=2 Tax=Desulfotalea psychrophila TaxID=84980 RepID=Q6AKF6_DESPS|nr:unknown protein [Desulfotalea psychrophila LSv54]
MGIMGRKQSNGSVSKELMLRSKITGRWIKRSDEEIALSENSIPKTLVQIQQNNIYYTDTNLIISNFVKIRYEEK